MFKLESTIEISDESLQSEFEYMLQFKNFKKPIRRKGKLNRRGRNAIKMMERKQFDTLIKFELDKLFEDHMKAYFN